MHKITFECETITPMFLAGADSKTPELRAPSIKGLLRFWWRALHGHLPIEELRKEEAKIFGGAGEKEKKSSFSVVVRGNFKSSLKRFPNHPVSVTSRSRGRTFHINILDYLAYGLLEYKKGFIRPYILPGSRFIVILSGFEKPVLDEIKNVFWIFMNLGGLGSRSRNGFGNFQIKNADEVNLTPINCLSFKNSFHDDRIPKFTAFSKNMRIFKTRRSFDSWDKALAEIGKAYRDARGKLEPKHRYEKRQFLGAPIVVYKKTESFLERRAKPFFIHVQKTSNNNYLGLFFYLPSEYCSGLEIDRNNEKMNHADVNRRFLDYTQGFITLLAQNPNIVEIK